jgi:hypothetical protein
VLLSSSSSATGAGDDDDDDDHRHHHHPDLTDPKELHDYMEIYLARLTWKTRLLIRAIRLRRSLWALDSPLVNWLFYPRREWLRVFSVRYVPRIMAWLPAAAFWLTVRASRVWEGRSMLRRP